MDKETVRNLAKVCRLALTYSEIDDITLRLNQVLAHHINTLMSINTHGVEPTSHSSGLVNVFREDDPRASLSAGEALAAAPDTELQRFKVPRIQEN